MGWHWLSAWACVSEEIDICARIFAVADAFDAITSDRVYRRGKSYEAAAQELDDWAGRQFDPKVVEAFHRVPKEDWEELHRHRCCRSTMSLMCGKWCK